MIGGNWLRRGLIGLVATTGGCSAILLAGVQAAAPTPLTATTLAVNDIPAGYLTWYQDAALRCPGLDWPTLAAVGKLASDHGRDRHPQQAAGGATGPMQITATVWHTYKVDGNADGRTDPADPADAIPAAADYLCALDITGDERGALATYHCGSTNPACARSSSGYVAAVLGWAARYGAVTPDQIGNAEGPVARLAVSVALAQVGTPYRWGGAEPGGFDCSGLVQYAYAAAGLALPRVAQDQYDAGLLLPAAATLVAGDLLFFGSGPTSVDHVGIYLGGDEMVDAPHTGAQVRVEAVDLTAPAFVGATRPDATSPP